MKELNKMTMRELKAYYEELIGAPITWSVNKKVDMIDAIKSNLRAKQRGKAFKEWLY